MLTRSPRGLGTSLPAIMIAVVAVVAAIAWWDAERESRASLEDFASEQATLATSAAADLSTRLAALRRDALDPTRPPSDELTTLTIRRGAPPPAPPPNVFRIPFQTADGTIVDAETPAAGLLREVRRIQRPDELVLLLLAPGRTDLVAVDGHVVDSPVIEAALASPSASVRLSREQAAALGLPARTAIAGLAHVDAGTSGRWGIAVVASAKKQRDRDQRARIRLVSSVLVVAGLVFAFGTIALRNQRKELELARELEVRDLQRERDERLGRASRVAVMGTLATGVAHEISTPLAVIVGRAEQIAARANDDRTNRNAKAILEQAERIRDVVRGFLDLARGGRPTLASVAPDALVRSAVRLVEHRFEKASLELAVEAPSDLPSIHCDFRLLEHALVNLLLNACDASPEGSAVRVVVRKVGDRLAFDVIDRGPGISEEDRALAMEPFFTTKPGGAGTGLGLAITNEIVKAHRGTLVLAAEAPHGTRATIEIPIAPPLTEEDAPHAAA